MTIKIFGMALIAMGFLIASFTPILDWGLNPEMSHMQVFVNNWEWLLTGWCSMFVGQFVHDKYLYVMFHHEE